MPNLSGLIKSNIESNKRTKEAIQEALIQLMSLKDLKSITVKDIVSKAGVSRTSYYNNYSFKEEIIREFLKRIFNTIMKQINIDDEPYDTFYSIFKSLKENERLVHQLISAKLNFPIHYLWKTKYKNYTKIELYSLTVLEFGFTKLVKEWFENNTKESIDEMALLSTKIFPQLQLINK